MSSPLETARLRLVVDPIRCDGRALCAELLPEWIALDDWGFPIISDHPESAITEEVARRAIAACPTLALRLETRNRS
jgi:ferredoxin